MADPASDKDDRRSAKQRRKRRQNPDGTMSLVEHIYEFRRRFGYALLAIVCGGIFGFVWFGVNLGPVPSLGSVVIGPYCQLPHQDLLTAQNGQACRLLQTLPFEAFMTRLKVGLIAGMVVTSPLWLYQLWAFIAPGLHSKERKYALTFVTFASLLFAGGAVLAYVLVPGALKLLVSFGGDEWATALTGDKYISFVLSLLIIFGVSFELPLLVVMLNRVGAVRYEQLKRWRRGMIFGLFVFAAFATPGNDPISMLALAGALVVLFELAIQIARLHDRRLAKRRKAEGLDDLSDDEAAPFEYTPSAVEDTPANANARGPSATNTDDIT